MDSNERGIGRATDPPPQYHRGKNYFLGIGIDNYSKPYNRLRNCVNDISQVQKALLDMYDFEEEYTHLLLNETASRKGILKKLRDVLEKVTENDSLIFMYSGHGDNLDSSNIGFMIPADAADEEDFINLSDIKSRLDAAKAKHIFVIFDACFSGLLLTQRDARAQNLPENFPSRYAMTSGRNHPVDDGEGEHSPFAKALIDELRENDDSLGSVMLAQKILDRFRRTGKDDDQLPAFGRISSDIEYEGQYYFYPKNYELSAARERTKRLEAEQARAMAEQALVSAERERKRAEKLARAATNTASFLQARDEDPTVAMRMMQYNMQRHTDSKISHAMYYKLLMEATPFIKKILRGHIDLVRTVCFSSDAQFIATGSQDATVKIWSTTTGRCLKTLEGHGGTIFSVLFSSDDQYLFTGCEEDLVRMWSIEKGEVTKQFKIKKGFVSSLALSPDNAFLAVGCGENGTEIWSLESGKRLKILNEKGTQVLSVAFSPDGKHVATGGDGYKACYWSIDTGEVLKTFGNSEVSMFAFALSADGKYLATGNDTGVAHLWSISTGECLKEFKGHLDSIYAMAFSPDLRYLATGSADRSTILWDVEKGSMIYTAKSQHGVIQSLAFSKDGEYLAMGHYDNNATIWHTYKCPNARMLLANQGIALSIELSKDGKYLASAHDNQPINLWSLETDTIVKSFSEDEEPINKVSLSPDDNYIALIGEGRIYFHDIKKGKRAKAYEGTEVITAFAFFHDSTRFAVGYLNHQTIVWSVETGEALQTFVGQENYVNAVALTSDDKYLIIASEDGTIKLWSIETGAAIKTFTTQFLAVKTLAISADGKYLAGGCDDCKIFLWALETGVLINILTGHQNSIESLAFSADGQYVASGSTDKTVKLWSTVTGRLIKTFVGHLDAIRSIVWSADDKQLITASEDGSIRFWNIATDGIEDRTATYTLYEMMDFFLEIEPEDTPQYIDELVEFIAQTNMDKEDALLKVDMMHALDPSVGVELRRRLA